MLEIAVRKKKGGGESYELDSTKPLSIEGKVKLNVAFCQKKNTLFKSEVVEDIDL